MFKKSSLNDTTNYESLCIYFSDNKEKPLQEWLDFKETFDKPGKQGLVGVLRSKKTPNNLYLFKISQYINYLVQHENTVMKGLNDISSYCPHFCKNIGSVLCEVNPKLRKTGNPFDIKDIKNTIEKEILLTEYLAKSCKFYNYIRAVDKIPESTLYSTIKQVLLSIVIAQHKKQFTHYDLHSNNIMMKKCNKDLVFLYVLDEDNQFCVPTLGHYPIIIDFGFSYIKDMDDGPLWPSLGHTNVGFMSDRFDWVADPKLFLVTVSGEMKEKHNSKNSRKLRRIVRNIFYPLTIDWDSGWDVVEKKGATDYVTGMLRGYSTQSKLFREYDYYCIDLIQSLVILPLEYQNYSNINVSYTIFLKEWVKIENQINSSFYHLYILKGVVDAARLVRAAYIDDETRLDAINTFREKIFTCIDNIAKFVNIKNLHCEKLLCSLIILSKNIEGVLYDVITARMTEKQKEYDRLPLQSIEQIYGVIETNFPDNYTYNENTTIYIINSKDENGDLFNIPTQELYNINQLHPIARGTYIYDLYKNI